MSGKAANRLAELKTSMLLHTPFFASLMLDQMTLKVGKFPQIFGGNHPTAATDGKTIWFDEDFLLKLSLREAVFVMCHEIGHAMWQHMDRGKRYKDTNGPDHKPFNHKRWNIAGDYVINDMLVESKIGSMPKINGQIVGLHDPKFPFTMLVDDVYKALPDDPEGEGFDEHILELDERSPVEWARAAASAADAAKAMGKMPAALQRFVDSLLNPVVPWTDLLRKSLSLCVGRDTDTWRKLNRRQWIVNGIIAPAKTGFGAGTVVIAVDTSGSIGPVELKRFLSETQGILDDLHPELVIMIACDATVHDVTYITNGASLADDPPPMTGGGGTSFIPVFDWLANEGIKPDALVYFTDMYGCFPEEASGFPTIWCSTSDIEEAPFGEVVRIPREALKESD